MNGNEIYKVTKIGEDTYLIDEKLSTMFVLVGSEKGLVIDSGTGIGDFKSVVESLMKGKPYYFVATHSHVDHIGGRGQFGDIYLSEKDSKYIKSVTALYRRFYALSFEIMGGFVKNKHFTKIEKEPTVHYVAEGDTFDLGDRVIKVYSTPGHTVGSISLLDERDRTFYIGDVMNENLFMWLPHSTTIDTAAQTMKKIMDIKGYDRVWASHHDKSFDKNDLTCIFNSIEKLQKKKNSLPIISFFKDNGNLVIYKRNRIH